MKFEYNNILLSAKLNNKCYVNKEDLLSNIIKLNGNLTQIGKMYGITDNAVRKWCKKFGFPSHSKELKEYIKNMS